MSDDGLPDKYRELAIVTLNHVVVIKSTFPKDNLEDMEKRTLRMLGKLKEVDRL